MARAGLNLRAVDLAARAGLTRVTVARFEAGQQVDQASVAAMRKALVDAGVAFTNRAGRVGVSVAE